MEHFTSFFLTLKSHYFFIAPFAVAVLNLISRVHLASLVIVLPK